MSQHVQKRKRAKKRKKRMRHRGRTTKEEQKMREENTFGQTEIAEYLGVDRSTIARWCRAEGLPYERSAHGKEHRIELRTAVHWLIGHRYAQERGLDFSPLEKILHALAMHEIRFKKYPNFESWKTRMLNEFDWIDVTRDQLLFGLGRLSGFKGGLPFK